MQYKLIENYHVENAVLQKDFNLGATNSFFHAFTQKSILKTWKFAVHNLVEP